MVAKQAGENEILKMICNTLALHMKSVLINQY